MKTILKTLKNKIMKNREEPKTEKGILLYNVKNKPVIELE